MSVTPAARRPRAAAAVRAALRDGILVARRGWRLVLMLYAADLLLALVLVAPVAAAALAFLARTTAAERLATGLDLPALQELSNAALADVAPLWPLAGLVALAALAASACASGAVYAAACGERGAGPLAAAAARHAGPLWRVGLWAAPLWAAAAAGVWAAGRALWRAGDPGGPRGVAPYGAPAAIDPCGE
ncbi:MAG TPA: hypothetical protein VG389_25655 [Myxococcota bacterium]|nr:hypothetical protein [Myxococcota bacterium]